MTSDDLIRQVATEIKQNIYRATMEEALDAAKAVTAIFDKRISKIREFYELRGVLTSGMTNFGTSPELTAEAMIAGMMKLQLLHQGIQDGEDYQLLSTAPQIVEEIIEPEVKG